MYPDSVPRLSEPGTDTDIKPDEGISYPTVHIRLQLMFTSAAAEYVL